MDSTDSSAENIQHPQEVLRHPDFWLRDGSIVLSVQHVLFKVHQTILAQHSEIFADLFDLPQPELQIGGDDQLDGCRVVQLQDSPDDFEDLLKAIYHLDHFETLSPAASLDDVLVFVTGILRLSTKYMVRGLRAKCIKLLAGRFPTTYDEYIARSPLARPYSPPAHRSGVDQNAINSLIELTHTTLSSLSDNGTVNAHHTTSTGRSNRPRRSQVSVTLNPANPPPSFHSSQQHQANTSSLPGGWPGSAPATSSSGIPVPLPHDFHPNPYWNPPSNANANASSAPPPPPSTPATQSTATSTTPTQTSASSQQQTSASSHTRHSHRHKSKHKLEAHKTAADAPKPTASSVMRAIAVAYEGRVYSILPYAYYLLARTSSPRRFLSKGNPANTPALASTSTPNLAGTAAGAAGAAVVVAVGATGVNALPTISWQEKTICLVGRALLRSAELSMSHSFLVAFQPSQQCRQPARCSNSRGPLLEWALLEAAGKGPEPLKGWDRWDKLGVCQDCVAECMRKHEVGRREVWERLPEFFDLEAWGKLRDLQDA